MGDQFVSTQGIVDSSIYTLPNIEFSQETHPTKVQDRKYPKDFAHNKYFHPATIGDVDIEELKAVCAYGVYDYNTGKRISTPLK